MRTYHFHCVCSTKFGGLAIKHCFVSDLKILLDIWLLIFHCLLLFVFLCMLILVLYVARACYWHFIDDNMSRSIY
jgi:hypothetical protein